VKLNRRTQPLVYTPAASVFIGDGWAKKDRQKKGAK